MQIYIGSHTHFTKENQLLGVVEEELSYGGNTLMLYTGSPSSTLRIPIDDMLTYKAMEKLKANNIELDRLFVHGPFVVNLASDRNLEKYDFYISFLKKEIERCISLGIKNLIIHPGFALKLEKKEALLNVSYGINRILEYYDSFNIIIEYMSGKGSEVCSNIDEIQYVIKHIDKKNQVFVCLDTCHMNDSGVDLNKYNEFLDEFEKKIGINKIKCIHINDSVNNIGEHKDRHANIGYGTIGFNDLLDVVYNKKTINISKILETPLVEINGIITEPYAYEIKNFKNKKFIDFIQ